jgi:hypothetical protein
MGASGTPPAIFASGARSSVGLCGGCSFAREVTTLRGSCFVLCNRSVSDDRYARYPQLPVLQCPGYEVRSEASK